MTQDTGNRTNPPADASFNTDASTLAAIAEMQEKTLKGVNDQVPLGLLTEELKKSINSQVFQFLPSGGGLDEIGAGKWSSIVKAAIAIRGELAKIDASNDPEFDQKAQA